MGKLIMTDYMPNDIAIALERLESMHCYVHIAEHDDLWRVYEGVEIVFVGDSHGEAEAFVIGQAWTYEALQPEIKEVVQASLAP